MIGQNKMANHQITRQNLCQNDHSNTGWSGFQMVNCIWVTFGHFLRRSKILKPCTWSRHLTNSVGQSAREDQKAARNPENPFATAKKTKYIHHRAFDSTAHWNPQKEKEKEKPVGGVSELVGSLLPVPRGSNSGTYWKKIECQIWSEGLLKVQRCSVCIAKGKPYCLSSHMVINKHEKSWRCVATPVI